MQITLHVNNPEAEEQELRLLTLGVSPDMTIEMLRSSIEAEGIPAPSQHLYHNGQLIDDNTKTLQELQITDGDMLGLHVRDMRGSGVQPGHRDQGAPRPPVARPSAPAAPAAAPPMPQDPELIRLQVLGDPNLRAQLQRLNPPLAAVIEDPQRFAQLFQSNTNEQENARRARMREIELLNADEFNPDAQARIEEMHTSGRIKAPALCLYCHGGQGCGPASWSGHFEGPPGHHRSRAEPTDHTGRGGRVPGRVRYSQGDRGCCQ
ncbi:hypothetical protein F4808DRAFT_115721 [Astrocystis sublimbata]|nr:hypothetical protein F4808DRAFT_115721 [Astrocystis sublimbata]